MALTAHTDTDWNELAVVTKFPLEDDRKQRVPAFVDKRTLFQYFEYLSDNLSFPFTTHYPEPRPPLEEDQYECSVLELLDPSKYASDEFDGIFCKTSKAGFEVNLPLVELGISPESPNFQVIEDYWYWFCSWRCR